MVQDPNRLSHNAVGARLRIRPRHRVEHHRPDAGQSQFAGYHQSVRAGARDHHINHLAHASGSGAARDNRRVE